MRLDLKSLSQKGFVKFSCNSPVEKTLEIAHAIGHIATLSELAPVQTLTPNEANSKEKSSYSGNFGMGVFPLHTDMAHWYIPPRFFLLRCIQAAKQVHTNFVCAREIFESEDPIILKRALFRPRRRLDGRLTILRLYDDEIFRWDTLFLQPINKYALQLQARIVSNSRRMDSLLLKNDGF